MFNLLLRRPLAALALLSLGSTALAQTSQPLLGPTLTLEPATAERVVNGNPRNPQLGADVAIRGALAITSMPSHQGGGRVAVWTRISSGGWERSGTIDPQPNGGAASFGETVALGTDRAFISTFDGTVQAFVRAGTAWIFEQTISPGSPGLGVPSLAFDQGWLIATFLGHDGPQIYARRNGTWQQVQLLDSGEEVAGDGFGASYAIQNGTLVVGAPGRDQGRGAIYIFRLANGVWVRRQKITVANGAAGDNFGASVAIGGAGVIVVGAPEAQRLAAPTCGTSGASGAAYVYELSGATWVSRQVLSHRFADCHRGFGSDVGVTFNHLAVKSDAIFPDYRSTTVLYRRSPQGGWQLVGRDAGYDFSSLTISPTTMIVGVPSEGAFNQGIANVYELFQVAP